MRSIKHSLALASRLLQPVGVAFLLSILMFAQGAYAESAVGAVNIDTLITNLSNTIPSLMRLVTAAAYVMGISLSIKGLFELKKLGEQRSMMSSSEGGLKGPLIYLTIGSLLLFLPSALETGLSTFWAESTPYAYETMADDSWHNMIKSVFLIVQLVGTISFIKGLIIFTHMSGQSSQPGTFGKAITHIVAGILCINMYNFVQAVTNTLGLTFSWQ